MKNLCWQNKGDAYYLASPFENLVKLHHHPGKQIVFWINDDEYVVRRSGQWNQHYAIYLKNCEVLSVSHDHSRGKGKIKMRDGLQYVSECTFKESLTLRFLDGEASILSYHLRTEDGKQKIYFNPGIVLVDVETILILAALGMVMLLNIYSELK